MFQTVGSVKEKDLSPNLFSSFLSVCSRRTMSESQKMSEADESMNN